MCGPLPGLRFKRAGRFYRGQKLRHRSERVYLRSLDKEGFEGYFPDFRDFETHLSLHFPEVRARGFLELRSMDAQMSAWHSVPASFCCALIYDDQSLEEVVEEIMPHFDQLDRLLLASAKD